MFNVAWKLVESWDFW